MVRTPAARCGQTLEGAAPTRPTRRPPGTRTLLRRRRRLGWQPSRFLADRAEAERAFRLAERLGSVNAAAQELGTTWPSLRKAFGRHGLGMPARNPQAVRQRAVDAARQRTGQPSMPPLDPMFVALNPDVLPDRPRPPAGQPTCQPPADRPDRVDRIHQPQEREVIADAR